MSIPRQYGVAQDQLRICNIGSRHLVFYLQSVFRVGLLWILIKCTDPKSSAFFFPWRTGLHGVRFRLIKMRTMIPGAENLQASLAKFNLSTGPDFKMMSDPRVTRLGRFLRRTHLDEVPQLIQVLTGDMSLVGSRPYSFPTEAYQTWWWPRLLCTPGMTGISQIVRAETHNFDERVRYDIRYLRSRSFAFDCYILWRTVVVAVQGKGM